MCLVRFRYLSAMVQERLKEAVHSNFIPLHKFYFTFCGVLHSYYMHYI